MPARLPKDFGTCGVRMGASGVAVGARVLGHRVAPADGRSAAEGEGVRLPEMDLPDDIPVTGITWPAEGPIFLAGRQGNQEVLVKGRPAKPFKADVGQTTDGHVATVIMTL